MIGIIVKVIIMLITSQSIGFFFIYFLLFLCLNYLTKLNVTKHYTVYHLDQSQADMFYSSSVSSALGMKGDSLGSEVRE